MPATITVKKLRIDKVLYDFVNQEAMPGTDIREQAFWSGFAALVAALAARNAALLQRRDELQASIDAWHRQHPGAGFDRARYKAHLLEIGYLTPERAPFAIDTVTSEPSRRSFRKRAGLPQSTRP